MSDPTTYHGWHKSSRTNGQGGACVEVGYRPGQTAVRDTKNRSYAMLEFSNNAWAAFVSNIKSGRING